MNVVLLYGMLYYDACVVRARTKHGLLLRPHNKHSEHVLRHQREIASAVKNPAAASINVRCAPTSRSTLVALAFTLW